MLKKTMNFYWGGNKCLSYMRYLSIKSFCDKNPDWEVILHSPKTPNTKESWGTREQKSLKPNCDYIDYVLQRLPNLTRKVHDNLPDYPEVQRSDIMRIFILAGGGFYSDTDILYLKPMYKLLDRMPSDTDVVLCKDAMLNTHYIGFLGSSKENTLFKGLFNVISGKQYENSEYYQSFGAMLFNSYIEKNNRDNSYYAPLKAIYPVDASGTIRLFSKRGIDISGETIGIHWYGGDPIASKYENEIVEENIFEYDNFLIEQMRGVI